MKGSLLCLGALLILQILTPFWWWILLVPFVYGGAFAETGWKGFRTGMLSAGLLWLFAGLTHLLTKSDIVAQRMSAMMKVNSPWILLIITTFIAALSAGFAGSTGFLVKSTFWKRKELRLLMRICARNWAFSSFLNSAIRAWRMSLVIDIL